MLNATKITKSYNSAHEGGPVLKSISLTIPEGDMTCIIGRSGSGKSTLLNILSTLLRPDQGEVSYRDKLLTSLSDREINRLRSTDFGMIFQMHHLLPYLTALENVLLPHLNRIRSVSAAQKEAAVSALERVGLGDKLHRLPGELSGGEQQRVAIARALGTSPRVIFADEPTGSLDKTTGDGIVHLLKEINETGITVVMVTHENEYRRLADQVIEIEDGRLLSVSRN